MSANPWKGVVPYSDTDDPAIHPFRGRNKEIEELLFTVRYNNIATLYGQSGIGKTSLLLVGLFPRLVEEGFRPLELRLGIDDPAGKGYAQRITDALSSLTKPLDTTVPTSPDDESEDYLWHFLAYHSFNDTVPVVVLDQFEEVLRNHPDLALTLLRQLRATQQESYRSDGSPYDVNCHFLISLREDDLYLLEDMLDRHYIDCFKQGRYRLAPMSDSSAREIIALGKLENNDTTIADRLIQLATQDDHISTIVLSVACSMAYDLERECITRQGVEALGDNPMAQFYQQAMQEVPPAVQQWVEDTFVDQDRRRPVALTSFPEGYKEHLARLMDEQDERHIFTHTSRARKGEEAYELLHDKLALTIAEKKRKREAEKAQRKAEEALAITHRRNRILWIAAGSVILLALLLWLVSLGVKSRIPFNPDKLTSDGAIPIYSRLYHVKDSTLVLRNCRVKPYTFINNPEVRTLVLDSADWTDRGNNLSSLDTVIFTGKQYGIYSVPDSIHILIANRPTLHTNALNNHQIARLDSVIIKPEDSLYLMWKNGALYARHKPDTTWVCRVYRINKYSEYYIDTADYSPSLNLNYNYHYLIDYDIANPTSPNDLPTWCRYNVKWRLTCSDSSRTTLRRKDIDSIRGNIAIIDLPYIKQIEANTFAEYTTWGRLTNYTLKRIYCPSLERVEDSTFYSSNSLWIFIAPKLQEIGKYAFGNCLDSIEIPTECQIANSAFNGCDKLQKNTQQKSPQDTSSNNNTTYSNIIHHNGYYNYTLFPIPNSLSNRNNVYPICIVYLDSICIPKIKISSNTLAIGYDDNFFKWHGGVIHSLTVDTITCSKKNKLFYTWHGDLYHDSTLILQKNRKKYVSLPHYIDKSACMSKENTSNPLCKKYVALYRNDLPTNKSITLYVPYGQKRYYSKEDWNEVKELSLFSTIYYRLAYSHPHHPFAWIIKYEKATERFLILNIFNQTISLDDIIAFSSCILFMALLWFFIIRKNRRNTLKKYIWLDLGVAIGILIIAWIVTYFWIDYKVNIFSEKGTGIDIKMIKTTNKSMSIEHIVGGITHYISMWPVWWFAPALWIVWLWLSNKFIKKKKQAAITPRH